MESTTDKISLATGITIDTKWRFVGESYSVDSEEQIVQSLRSAYKTLNGQNLEIAGISSIIDTSRLVPIGNVPSVPIDFHGESAHADNEFVHLDRVEEGCRLALLTAIRFLTSEYETHPE